VLAGARPEGRIGTWCTMEPAPGGGLHQGGTWRGALDLTLFLARSGAGDLAGYRGYPCHMVSTVAPRPTEGDTGIYKWGQKLAEETGLLGDQSPRVFLEVDLEWLCLNSCAQP
jgi:hypothetical protein